MLVQYTSKYNQEKLQLYKAEHSLSTDWTKYIGNAVKDRPIHLLADLDPCMHLMAERKSEKDKQYLTHPRTAA